MNKIIATGKVVSNPELKQIKEDSQVCQFRFVIKNVKDVFIDVEVWGKQAEIAAKHLHRGKPLLIEGYLKQDQWEKDGEKRSKIYIGLDRFEFLN